MTENEFLRSLENASDHDAIPLQAIARTLYNLERIANAQEIIAGVRTKSLAPGNGAIKQNVYKE